jgi:hypothetical protein
MYKFVELFYLLIFEKGASAYFTNLYLSIKPERVEPLGLTLFADICGFRLFERLVYLNRSEPSVFREGVTRPQQPGRSS